LETWRKLFPWKGHRRRKPNHILESEEGFQKPNPYRKNTPSTVRKGLQKKGETKEKQMPSFLAGDLKAEEERLPKSRRTQGGNGKR